MRKLTLVAQALPSQARRPSPRKPCLVVIDECALRGRQRCHDRSVVHAMPSNLP
jgi:hypothetical protein